MKKFLLILVIFIFSCSGNNFNVKKENNYFGLRFYIFVTKDEDVFKGKGEGFLDEKSFICDISDLLLNKKVVSMLFDIKGLKAYVYTQEMGYFVASPAIGEFFSKDFFYLFKSGETNIRKIFVDLQKEYELNIDVIKVQNGFPKRVAFLISSSDEIVKILLDIYELTDRDYNLKFDIDISEFYQYNIFEFFRSIQ
ncbi:MAG: hypothetical protein N2258_02355 [Brevinematales bacterium]|nr:hypothetical protein [Brevinematales bacterium]